MARPPEPVKQRYATEARGVLQKLQEENPRLPAGVREVIAVLSSDAAAPAWRVLGSDKDTVDAVVHLVWSAYKTAQDEAARTTEKAERDDLNEIIKLSRKLARLIRGSLPGDQVQIGAVALQGDRMRDVLLDVGWHSLRPGGYGIHHALAITDVLEWTEKMAMEHTDRLPLRATQRGGGNNVAVTAFIRCLAWLFQREFGREMRGTIGHIASAVFDLSEPLDEKNVAGKLKNRPKWLTPPT